MTEWTITDEVEYLVGLGGHSKRQRHEPDDTASERRARLLAAYQTIDRRWGTLPKDICVSLAARMGGGQ